MHQDHAQVADDVALPCSSDLENLVEGSAWILDGIIFFCKMMGLAHGFKLWPIRDRNNILSSWTLTIEGMEMELLSFLACLEANRMKGDHLVEESVGDDVVGDRLFQDKANH